MKLDVLTDDELSALICACQLAEDYELRGQHVRPPWGKAGTPAHKKLIAAEFARAEAASDGKREDTTCPVADYIRRNKAGLAQEHPDGIWDVSPAHEQAILNRQDIARDFGDMDDVGKHWRGE